MNIFVDSSFFVATIASQDINHKLAKTIGGNYLDQHLFTNDLVKYETYNVLCRKYNVKSANLFLYWLKHSGINYIDISPDIWGKSVKLLTKKYSKSGPNVFDYIHFSCMNEYCLKDVLTFDHHFSSFGFNILE